MASMHSTGGEAAEPVLHVNRRGLSWEVPLEHMCAHLSGSEWAKHGRDLHCVQSGHRASTMQAAGGEVPILGPIANNVGSAQASTWRPRKISSRPKIVPDWLVQCRLARSFLAHGGRITAASPACDTRAARQCAPPIRESVAGDNRPGCSPLHPDEHRE